MESVLTTRRRTERTAPWLSVFDKKHRAAIETRVCRSASCNCSIDVVSELRWTESRDSKTPSRRAGLCSVAASSPVHLQPSDPTTLTITPFFSLALAYSTKR